MKKKVKKISDIEKKMLNLKKKLVKFDKDEDAIHIGQEEERPLSYISTGDPELDRIITPKHYRDNDEGGVPRGFLCEFFGPTGGGKSSLCMNLAASVTQKKGIVLWVDVEGSFVEDWAKSRGIDTDFLVRIHSGKNAEYYMKQVELAAASGDYELIVIDSLAGLQPKAVKEKSLEESPKIAARATLMSRTCPEIVPAAKKGNCSVIFINQIRYKMNIKYGNPETTPGGEALKYFSSLRLRLAQLTASGGRGIMKDGEDIGIRSNVQIVKSRFGPPFKETVISFYYGDEKPEPFDMLLDLALSSKIIRTRTRNNIQHFTMSAADGSDEKYAHENLKGVPGIEDFKSELVQLPDQIKEIGRRLVEEKKKALPSDVKYYIEHVEDSPLEQD